jgi:hypothetical protein
VGTANHIWQRLVIKVGSGLLRAPQGGLCEEAVHNLVQQLASLRRQGPLAFKYWDSGAFPTPLPTNKRLPLLGRVV